MVTQHVAEYPSNHVAHGPGKFEVSNHTVKEMHLKGNTFFELDLGIKVTLTIAQHTLRHVNYFPAKF